MSLSGLFVPVMKGLLMGRCKLPRRTTHRRHGRRPRSHPLRVAGSLSGLSNGCTQMPVASVEMQNAVVRTCTCMARATVCAQLSPSVFFQRDSVPRSIGLREPYWCAGDQACTSHREPWRATVSLATSTSRCGLTISTRFSSTEARADPAGLFRGYSCACRCGYHRAPASPQRRVALARYRACQQAARARAACR